MMIGQAGAFRVASELLLRGHVPSVPAVDTGVDIILDNGLRLQVKSVSLRPHPGYDQGAYCFSIKDNNYGSKKRDWAKVVDFLIYWGIDESRFFVVPALEATQNFWVRPKEYTRVCVSVDTMRILRDKGMTFEEIAQQLGVSRQTVARNLVRPSKLNSPRGNRHLSSFEDRWDLLDVNRAIAEIEEQVMQGVS
jgi:predicted DNA-binding protein YlxM (UPF0122 family)